MRITPVYSILVENTRRKISLGDPDVNHEGNIKIHLSLSSAHNAVSCCDIICPRSENVPLSRWHKAGINEGNVLGKC
jgi:hypothetical protein